LSHPQPAALTQPARWHLVAGAVVLAAIVVVIALLIQHDAWGDGLQADISIRSVMQQYGFLVGFLLIYIEESGLPIFIPGDAYLLYIGDRLAQDLPILLVAWLAMIFAVTLGATNLYLIARRFGRPLLNHRFARFMHVTAERLDEAELWFRRWGPWAVILGRHIPGFRVPLTVAAGILKLPYPLFAVSVAISSAAWTAVFLALGALFGAQVERSMRAAPGTYALCALGAGLIAVAAFLIVSRHRSRVAGGDRPGAKPRPGASEAPSSAPSPRSSPPPAR
jgi:membrane protein DedA with SNARE-associated domain